MSVEAGGDQKDETEETGGRDGGSRGGGEEVLFGLDRIRNKSIRGTEDVDVWGQTEMGGTCRGVKGRDSYKVY